MTVDEAIETLEILRILDAPGLSEAVHMAISALRAQQEAKSPCAVCGYGGKHLDAPPCTSCPAHPKEPEKNEPLTLDELRKMDGQSVWLVISERYQRLKHWDGWSTVMVDDELKRFGIRLIRMFKPGCGALVYYNEDYGKDWTAYHRPPERSTE